jgi:hypothetical protein
LAPNARRIAGHRPRMALCLQRRLHNSLDYVRPRRALALGAHNSIKGRARVPADTASVRMPFSRMLPRAIGSIGSLKRAKKSPAGGRGSCGYHVRSGRVDKQYGDPPVCGGKTKAHSGDGHWFCTVRSFLGFLAYCRQLPGIIARLAAISRAAGEG